VNETPNEQSLREANEHPAEFAAQLRKHGPDLLRLAVAASEASDKPPHIDLALFQALACGWPAGLESAVRVGNPSKGRSHEPIPEVLMIPWFGSMQDGDALPTVEADGDLRRIVGPAADSWLLNVAHRLAAPRQCAHGLEPDYEPSLLTAARLLYPLPQPLERRRLLAATERKRRKDALTLTRQLGILSHVSLAAFEVDGQPMATATLAGNRRRWRLPQPDQGSLFPGPRTLASKAVDGTLVEAVADLNLGGDQRNPLRADVLRIGNLAYALSGLATIPADVGALIVAGGAAPTKRHVQRFENAVVVLNGLHVRLPGYPLAFKLATAELGGHVARIGPPQWINDPNAPKAYRLTGSLFRQTPKRIDDNSKRERWQKWGVIERTVAGIESALAYGPAAGKGRDARIPDNLRPVRTGGPGPEVFIPWWQVLRLSGEAVTSETAGPSERWRWKRRHEALAETGYMVGARESAAPAGDTVEVIRIVRGARARTAGLVIRATARYCAAYRDRVKVRIPAVRLIELLE